MVSAVPSYLVEILVTDHHYRALEIPFPQSLALRYGWAGNGKILAYTYDVIPAVPEKDISTVTVSMYLVANSKTDPEAISRVLETLFSPSVLSQLRITLTEKDIAATTSGYPVSEGTERFLTRMLSVFTMETWNKLTSIFGLVMSFSGMGLVLLKWFKGAAPTPANHDAEFKGYLAEAVAADRAVTAMRKSGGGDRQQLETLRERLDELRATLYERYPTASLTDARLFDHCTAAVRAAHERVTGALGGAA
jgi:hypothetical protein